MGATANLTLLADAIDRANSFIWAFAAVYTFVIFLYILSSWVRLPYSPWLSRIQRAGALLGRYLDVPRCEQEDLVGDALHSAVERVREAAREVDQALRELLV